MLDEDSKALLEFMTHLIIRVLLLLFGILFVISLFSAWHDRHWPVPKVYRIEIDSKVIDELDQDQRDQLDKLAEIIAAKIKQKEVSDEQKGNKTNHL